jgi:hypothetical protein
MNPPDPEFLRALLKRQVDAADAEEMQEVTFEFYYATHPTTIATPRVPVGRLDSSLTVEAFASTADHARPLVAKLQQLLEVVVGFMRENSAAPNIMALQRWFVHNDRASTSLSSGRSMRRGSLSRSSLTQKTQSRRSSVAPADLMAKLISAGV